MEQITLRTKYLNRKYRESCFSVTYCGWMISLVVESVNRRDDKDMFYITIISVSTHWAGGLHRYAEYRNGQGPLRSQLLQEIVIPIILHIKERVAPYFGPGTGYGIRVLNQKHV